jgi:hypothetical protein
VRLLRDENIYTHPPGANFTLTERFPVSPMDFSIVGLRGVTLQARDTRRTSRTLEGVDLLIWRLWRTFPRDKRPILHSYAKGLKRFFYYCS